MGDWQRRRQGNVVALGLAGREDAQPVGQFKRAFGTAQKKNLLTVASAGDHLGAGGIRAAVNELQPTRLVSCWPSADNDAVLKEVLAASRPAILSVTGAINQGLAATAADFPLKRLLDSDAQLALSCDRPSLYQKSLIDEYVTAREDCGIAVDQLIRLARGAIELSFMEAERKEVKLREFDIQAKAALDRFLSSN